MKKIYSILGLVAIAGQTLAQAPISSMNYPSLKTTKNESLNESVSKKPTTTYQEKGITLWSNTCNSAADWTFTNTSIPAGGNWSIQTGPYTAAIQSGTPFTQFESTTAADGYLMINSDAIGGADQNGTPTICEATIAVPTGTLSAYPFVSLKFQHNYRWWQDTRGVRVSGDNGTTWTEFEITNNAGFPNLQSSENPVYELINISAIAGGAADVLVQFYYNDNDYWGWYWAVDDVEIVETDEFDLAVTGLYWGSTGAYGARLPYYQVPVNQVAAVDLGGGVTNFGYGNQTDVVFSITETTTSFTGSSAPSTLATFAVDTLELTTQFTPAGLGNYSFDAEVTSPASDAFPSDNAVTAMAAIAVTNNIYARDMDNRTGGTLNRDAAGFAAPYQVGNIFDIITGDDLYAVDFYVSPTTDVESDYNATLYRLDAGDFTYITETDFGIIDAADLDTWITVTFDNAQPLQAGQTYLVVIGSQGGIGQNGLVTGTSGNSEAQTSFFLDETGTWFFTTSTPMVRMNFDLSLSTGTIAENSMNINVYPNPAKDVANVNFELENNSDVTLTISDLSGKVVFTTTENNVAAGKNSIVVSTAGFANGVYTYSFVAGNVVVTEKLVINK
jgi:hypothetical protein